MNVAPQTYRRIAQAIGVLLTLMGLSVIGMYGAFLVTGTNALAASFPTLDAISLIMVASIGPFWDANETWLVLAVGLLLVAFPSAHGLILSTLYLPVFVMLVGLILRGVAFEFRAKARSEQKRLWNGLFFVGSLMTALAQGFMLGLYIMGLEQTPARARASTWAT